MQTRTYQKLKHESFFLHYFHVAVLIIFIPATVGQAGEWPRMMHAYRGSTPTLDGVISPGEYEDAVSFSGVTNWAAQFNPVTDKNDLALKGWVKHNGENLYFALSVTDDVLYGIDTDRWLPDENAYAHELSRRGYPWFGDGVELLINASNTWSGNEEQSPDRSSSGTVYNAGDGSSWQMVCNLTKSRLGGIGVGGLIEGEQRNNVRSWLNYSKWIDNGAMKAVVKLRSEESGYVIEWMIKPYPCLEVRPEVYWSPGLGVVKMGLNISVQDLDEKDRGRGNFGNFNHENWWAGEKDKRTMLKQWGTLLVHPGPMPTEFYVATDGDDNNIGSAEKPFATLERARNVVRKLIEKGLDRDVLVIIRGGTYQLERPLVLGLEDSGTSEHSITYTTYPGHSWSGETVVISGGRPITGWKKAGDNLWTAQVPEVKSGKWWFRQLFADGRRLVRGRFPNDGVLTIREVSDDVKRIAFTEPVTATEPIGSDAELVVLQNWSITRGRVVSIAGDIVQTATPMGWIGHIQTTAHPKKSAYLEHALAFVDQPGEWYLDRRSGTLTYMASDGENPAQHSFYAPKLEQLLIVVGREDNPICNVHFHGLTFEHTEWPLPEEGYRGIQAGYYGTSLEPKKPVYGQPAAIELQYTEKCSFELCRVARTGASGITLAAGCKKNKIACCEFLDIGCNAINIGHKLKPPLVNHPMEWHWENPNDVPINNEVVNNYIHHCGEVSFGAVGIFVAFTQQTKISHNLITDMPYTGISIGWSWNTIPTSQQRCLVEYNHIYNVMKCLADGGGIYTLGFQSGTILRGNLIHDVPRSAFTFGADNNGFFFDQGSKGFHAEGNIVYNTSGEAIRFNQSSRQLHSWKDNHFDVAPTDANFPWRAAGQTGLEPTCQKILFRK